MSFLENETLIDASVYKTSNDKLKWTEYLDILNPDQDTHTDRILYPKCGQNLDIFLQMMS